MHENSKHDDLKDTEKANNEYYNSQEEKSSHNKNPYLDQPIENSFADHDCQ